MTPLLRPGAGAVCLAALVFAPGAAGGPAPVGPVRIANGAVVWSEHPVAFGRTVRDGARALSAASTRADSIAAWRGLTTDPLAGPFALAQLAPLLVAVGDTAGADSAWAAVSAARGVWTYDALRGRADLRIARNDFAGADSLLAPAVREDWPELERASWLVRRAELRAALGDTAHALELARQTIRRFPALPPAARALDDAQGWEGSRPPEAAEDVIGAEVEFYRPDHAAAVRRLARAAPGLPEAERAGVELRRAEILRLDRKFPEAARACSDAEHAARDSAQRAAVALARARIDRDAGRPDSAYVRYRQAAKLAPEPSVRETAWWELAREAEDRERWEVAREGYAAVIGAGGRRAGDAAVRDGLIAWAAGDSGAALARWRGTNAEAAQFWRAIAARAAGGVGSEPTLDSLAHRPGYTFYRMAARETLGVRGWPGSLASASDSLRGGLRLAAALLALGAPAEAFRVLDRWGAQDARLAEHGAPSRPDPGELLAAARIAFGAERYGIGIRWARAAFDSLAARGPAAAWSVQPWLYPPAFDTLFARYPAPDPPESGGGLLANGRPDRVLLYSVCWQESKFDPLARSRSNALGLMQLKLATAAEEARALKLKAPHEADLFDPALNLRLGASHLGRLLRRFDGRPAMALAAYNAGATAARRWARPQARGGEALACERIGYGQAYDYVRTILGVRQAAREMPARRE